MKKAKEFPDIDRVCRICKKAYKARQRSSIYCSGACRTRQHLLKLANTIADQKILEMKKEHISLNQTRLGI